VYSFFLWFLFFAISFYQLINKVEHQAMEVEKVTPNIGWHVLCTYPNYEKRVYKTLLTQKIETYLPLIKVEKKWSDRKKVLEMPLFPNYIFIRPDANSFNYSSLSINGAVNFIKISGKPCLVHDNEIRIIQNLLSITHDITKECEYKIGDMVEVMDGPFQGLHGLVRGTNKTNKLYIHLQLLNQIISVEISDARTKKLPVS
jgi:transcriptional antiterminator RfaH